MNVISTLKAFAAILVIVGFMGVFGWIFYVTWRTGPDVARAQAKVQQVERDREDTLRRLEESRSKAASPPKEEKEARDRDVKVQDDKSRTLSDQAAAASAVLVAALALFGGENVNYLATSLAGLVGTVVATLFGQELQKKKDETPGRKKGDASVAARQTVGAAGELLLNVRTWRDGLSTLYAAVYLLYGVIAIGFWVFAPFSPEMVKNLAMISLTLILAIARGFFDAA